jgi:hypothetical protein
MPVLLYQRHRAIFKYRQDDGTARVMHDFAHIRLIALAHGVHGHIEHATGKHFGRIYKLRSLF